VTREIESDLRRLIEPILGDEGLELVEVALMGPPGRQMLRLDIDRAGATGVDISDCQRVSRSLDPVLEEADLIAAGYVLEVSSPGVDRPIRSVDDMRRNQGRWIVVTTAEAGGQQTYRGTLLGSSEGEIRLENEDRKEIRIPLDSVLMARREVRS